MKKLLFSIIIFLISFSLKANTALADSYVAGSSAQLKTVQSVADSDYRVAKLRAYLAKNNSPLTDYAQDFVLFADLYRLDWRLVAAISGVESTFGKRIPANSYNAYGWANGEYQFTSWENSIEVVSKTLREKYLDKGATTINQIARRYAPPSSTWARNVKFFMKKIDPMPLTFSLEG